MSESRCLGYITTWRPDRENLVISLGLQSNFIDSQTHNLIFLGNLIHVFRENKQKMIDNDNH